MRAHWGVKILALLMVELASAKAAFATWEDRALLLGWQPTPQEVYQIFVARSTALGESEVLLQQILSDPEVLKLWNEAAAKIKGFQLLRSDGGEFQYAYQAILKSILTIDPKKNRELLLGDAYELLLNDLKKYRPPESLQDAEVPQEVAERNALRRIQHHYGMPNSDLDQIKREQDEAYIRFWRSAEPESLPEGEVPDNGDEVKRKYLDWIFEEAQKTSPRSIAQDSVQDWAMKWRRRFDEALTLELQIPFALVDKKQHYGAYLKGMKGVRFHWTSDSGRAGSWRLGWRDFSTIKVKRLGSTLPEGAAVARIQLETTLWQKTKDLFSREVPSMDGAANQYVRLTSGSSSVVVRESELLYFVRQWSRYFSGNRVGRKKGIFSTRTKNEKGVALGVWYWESPDRYQRLTMMNDLLQKLAERKATRGQARFELMKAYRAERAGLSSFLASHLPLKVDKQGAFVEFVMAGYREGPGTFRLRDRQARAMGRPTWMAYLKELHPKLRSAFMRVTGHLKMNARKAVRYPVLFLRDLLLWSSMLLSLDIAQGNTRVWYDHIQHAVKEGRAWPGYSPKYVGEALGKGYYFLLDKVLNGTQSASKLLNSSNRQALAEYLKDLSDYLGMDPNQAKQFLDDFLQLHQEAYSAMEKGGRSLGNPKPGSFKNFAENRDFKDFQSAENSKLFDIVPARTDWKVSDLPTYFVWKDTKEHTLLSRSMIGNQAVDFWLSTPEAVPLSNLGDRSKVFRGGSNEESIRYRWVLPTPDGYTPIKVQLENPQTGQKIPLPKAHWSETLEMPRGYLIEFELPSEADPWDTPVPYDVDIGYHKVLRPKPEAPQIGFGANEERFKQLKSDLRSRGFVKMADGLDSLERRAKQKSGWITLEEIAEVVRENSVYTFSPENRAGPGFEKLLQRIETKHPDVEDYDTLTRFLREDGCTYWQCTGAGIFFEETAAFLVPVLDLSPSYRLEHPDHVLQQPQISSLTSYARRGDTLTVVGHQQSALNYRVGPKRKSSMVFMDELFSRVYDATPILDEKSPAERKMSQDLMQVKSSDLIQPRDSRAPLHALARRRRYLPSGIEGVPRNLRAEEELTTLRSLRKRWMDLDAMKRLYRRTPSDSPVHQALRVMGVLEEVLDGSLEVADAQQALKSFSDSVPRSLLASVDLKQEALLHVARIREDLDKFVRQPPSQQNRRYAILRDSTVAELTVEALTFLEESSWTSRYFIRPGCVNTLLYESLL